MGRAIGKQGHVPRQAGNSKVLRGYARLDCGLAKMVDDCLTIILPAGAAYLVEVGV
jgi:hypothetical protein